MDPNLHFISSSSHNWQINHLHVYECMTSTFLVLETFSFQMKQYFMSMSLSNWLEAAVYCMPPVGALFWAPFSWSFRAKLLSWQTTNYITLLCLFAAEKIPPRHVCSQPTRGCKNMARVTSTLVTVNAFLKVSMSVLSSRWMHTQRPSHHAKTMRGNGTPRILPQLL